jgi:hypothetical protein
VAPARSTRNAVENKFEQPAITENILSVLETDEVKKFVVSRSINSEDFNLIEELATFPKDMRIVGLHNLFNMSKENSGVDLENSIRNASDDKNKEMYSIALEFFNKYGWMTSLNLVRILEKI